MNVSPFSDPISNENHDIDTAERKSSLKMGSNGDRKKTMEDKLNESIIFLKKINRKKEKKLSGTKELKEKYDNEC